MPISEQQAIHRLDHSMPAARETKLGMTLDQMIADHNALRADYVAFQAKFAALLAHLDTANVAGIGNANAATYAPAAATSGGVAVLGSR